MFFLSIGLFFVILWSDQLNASIKVGDEFPQFSLKDQKGRVFSLKDFRGGPVLVNFWATWCPPCIEEMPSMDALNHSMKARRFNLIAVSVDDGWAPIQEFISQLNRRPSFLILLDEGRRLAKQLGLEKFPETFLISSEGRLLKRYIGAVEWLHPSVLPEIEASLEKNARKSQ